MRSRRFSLIVTTALTAALLGCPQENAAPKAAPTAAPPSTAADAPVKAGAASAPAKAGPASAPAEGGAASRPAAEHGAWTEQPIRRGGEFTVADDTPLASVVGEPAAYAGKTIKTKGLVQRACAKKGCWMELKPEGATSGIRVTFKDYGFFVPVDSEGAVAVVEGAVQIRKLDKATADHLREEGAKIVEDASGEVVEIGLVATAVELTKSP